MEELLVAFFEGRPHALPLDRRIPVGGGRDGAVVGAEADDQRLSRPALACQLAEVELAAAGEVGGACVAEVRVVRPDDDPRRAAGAREVFGERVERLCHVLVAHVPARDVAADERAVVALRVADEPRALLGGEEAVLGDAAVARGQLGGTLAKLDQLRHDLVLARLVREGVCLRIPADLVEAGVPRPRPRRRIRIDPVEIVDDRPHRRVEAVEVEAVEADRLAV